MSLPIGNGNGGDMQSTYVPNVLKVFISSKDSMSDERATIEKAVSDLKMVPIRRESTKCVATKDFDEYLRQTKEADIVLLLIDENNSHVEDFEKYYKYVKEEINLAFAEGKSVLLFVKECSSNPCNKFLDDVQYKVFARKFTNCMELYENAQTSLMNELFRKYKNKPLVVENRRQLYEFCGKYLKATRYKAIICENSPSFLLGPRKQVNHEKEYFHSIYKLLNKIKNGQIDATVTLIYNIEKTKKELMCNISQYDKSNFGLNCDTLRDIVGNNISVVAADQELVTFFVSDHTYIIGQHFCRHALAIIDNSPEIVNRLEIMMSGVSDGPADQGIYTFESILEEFSLNS